MCALASDASRLSSRTLCGYIAWVWCGCLRWQWHTSRASSISPVAVPCGCSRWQEDHKNTAALSQGTQLVPSDVLWLFGVRRAPFTRQIVHIRVWCFTGVPLFVCIPGVPLYIHTHNPILRKSRFFFMWQPIMQGKARRIEVEYASRPPCKHDMSAHTCIYHISY